jgi:hypothetical protein
MINHVYLQVGFGWALRAAGFVFLGLLVISNTIMRSRLKPTPKKFHVMQFIHPLEEPRFLFLTLACFTFAMAVYQPGTFIILDATSKGIDGSTASYLLAVLNAVR